MTHLTPRRGHINNRRHAPGGYVAVTKPLAQTLFDAGMRVTLCGNNVSAYHVFDGWHLGCTVHREQAWCSGWTFGELCADYLSYLDHALGTSLVFYVHKEDL